MNSFRTISRIAAFTLMMPLGATAQTRDGLSGPYLAARAATVQGDYKVAAPYYDTLVAADPANPYLLEYAIISHVALGETARAATLARQMDTSGNPSQIASLVILADYAAHDDFDAILAEIEGGRKVGPLVLGLFKAWSLLGAGRMSDATEAFDDVAKLQGLQGFALYHKALALASVGDFEGADEIFAGEAGGALRATRRGILAHAQVLSQLERNADAVALIDATFNVELDPEMASLRARLEAGEPLPFTAITTARDGLAEVLYTVAGALIAETTDSYTLAYSRLAESLRADFTDATLMSANMLEQQEQYDLATTVYNRIPRDDPAYHAAELGRADALINADRIDAAVEALQQLAKSYPNVPIVWTKLGDTLRRVERYSEAATAYDAAIALFDKPEPMQWPIYYARGIAREREKRWPEAEADFLMALKLNPEQPQVLNYLGYSYLEMQTNLDEALSMIERAVKARPDDGYITDSLGWGLFRLGRHKEAVGQMERAVELTPVDPIVNDHLGDVYWAVGRKLEAEFQWKRALSFKPDTEVEAARIRRKLEVGLDAVLKEEGADPIAVSENGGN